MGSHDWLVQARTKKGLTQQQIAHKVHVSRTHYTNIEKGHRRPSLEVAQKIAEELDVDWRLFYEVGVCTCKTLYKIIEK